MMSGRVSDYQVDRWLASLGPGWFSLHHQNPDISGAYASEVFGGGYTRAYSRLTLPMGRATWNISPLVFHSMPPIIITHVGLWNAEVNGDLLVSIALEQAISIVASKTFQIPEQQVAISIG